MNLAHAAKHPDQDYSGVIAQMEELAGVEVLNPGAP
jgi:hypothetical protein